MNSVRDLGPHLILEYISMYISKAIREQQFMTEWLKVRENKVENNYLNEYLNFVKLQ